MNRRESKGKPTFFWQPVFILLPVVGLACFGLYSMRQDRLLAEQEARDSGQVLAQQLAQAFGTETVKLLREYVDVNGTLDYSRTTLFGWSTWGGSVQQENDARQQMVAWQQANPEIDLTRLPPAQVYLKFQPSPPEPQAAEWLARLSPEQEQLWESAQKAQFADEGSLVAQSALQKFIDSKPPEGAHANAEYLLLLAKARGLPKDRAALQFSNTYLRNSPELTEAGLPVGQLVFFQALRRMPDGAGVSSMFLRHLRWGIYSQPSMVSPRIIAEAERVCKGTAAENDIATFRALWEADEVQRQVVEDFRDEHPTNTWTNAAFWVHSSSGNYLLPLADQRPFNQSPPRDTAFSCRIIPEAVFKKALITGAKKAGVSLPPYAQVEVQMAGKNVPLPVLGGSSAENRAFPALGRQAGVLKGLPGTGGDYPFETCVLLASPDILYARQSQRTLTFAALILASAFAAVIGLFSAYSSFRRQQQLSEMKSDFVSSVSHELRAPIASVRLMAEGLERGKILEPAKQHEYFKFIVQECRRLSSLIENVLDFSRIEEGRKRYEMESTDLVALTQQTVKVMETYAAERDISIALRVTGTALPVDLDGKAMQQALVNLIDNAIKHSPKGSNIAVDLDFNYSPAGAQSSSVLVSVEDHGEGIAASEQDKIFERFYRVGSELRRETQGVGIGLSIVKHIVEAHGGRVTVRSAPGQGSRFTIELPAASNGTRTGG